MLASLPSLRNFFTALSSVPLWQLLLELVIIGSVVYLVIQFLQGTRGARLLKGVVVLLITLYLGVRILDSFFDLARLSVLLDRFLFYASFAIIIVFQPELRRALMRLGETRLFRSNSTTVNEIEELIDACGVLSRRRVGALVALERDASLGGYTEQATRLDAEVSSPLLQTIFHPNTALHDLGVIISDGRISHAGVQFPLAESGDLPKELGSRHRAAVGLSQESDAVVLVVSEETGSISVAERGNLHRNVPIERLRPMLHEFLSQPQVTRVDTSPEQAPAAEKKAKPAKAKSTEATKPTEAIKPTESSDSAEAIDEGVPTEAPPAEAEVDSESASDHDEVVTAEPEPAPIKEVKPMGASVAPEAKKSEKKKSA